MRQGAELTGADLDEMKTSDLLLDGAALSPFNSRIPKPPAASQAPSASAFCKSVFREAVQGEVEDGIEDLSEEAADAIEDEAEYSFDVGDIQYTLRCSADRIDVTADKTLVVVDYKSGQLPTGTEVHKGEKPQLALEGALIQKGAFGQVPVGLDVEALEYWQINGSDDGGKISVRAPGGTQKEPVITADLINAAWDDLRTLIATYQNEDRAFIARVVRKGDFIEVRHADRPRHSACRSS